MRFVDHTRPQGIDDVQRFVRVMFVSTCQCHIHFGIVVTVPVMVALANRDWWWILQVVGTEPARYLPSWYSKLSTVRSGAGIGCTQSSELFSTSSNSVYSDWRAIRHRYCMVRAPIKRAVMTENKKFTHDMTLRCRSDHVSTESLIVIYCIYYCV